MLFGRSFFAALLLILAASGCTQSPKSAAHTGGVEAAAGFPVLGKPPFIWPDETEAVGQQVARSVAALAFDWPVNVPARVTRKFKSTQWVTGGEPTTTTERYNYALSAEPVAEGFRIVASEVKADLGGANVTDRVREAVNKSIGELAAVIFPAYVVGRDGRYLRLENPEQVRADARALLEVARMSGSSATSETFSPELTEEMLKDENLAAASMFEWNSMVGAWTGSTLTSGEAAQFRLTQVGGQAAGSSGAPLAATARLVGHVRCGASAAEDSCVALELRLQADAAYLEEKTAIVLRNIAKPDVLKNVSIDVEAMSQEIAIRVVTEPETLRPHHMQIVSRTRFTMAMLESIKVPSRFEEELLLDFWYPAP